MKPGPAPGTMAAKAGGLKVLAMYGKGFYSTIGKKGGDATKDAGHDFAEAGRRGGEATKARHGREFYQEIGRKGGQNGRGSTKVRQ